MAMKELQRKKAHREWLMRNLTTSLVLYERIKTTKAKAKELRRFADRVIVASKKADLVHRRRVRAWLADPLAAKKLNEILVPRYHDRTSGFTRTVRLGNRVGDQAPLVLVELMPDKKLEVANKTITEKVTVPAKKRGLPSLRQPKAKVTVRRKGATHEN